MRTRSSSATRSTRCSTTSLSPERCRDDNGEIVDFVIEYVNSHDSSGARRGSDGLVGQLICEIHPDWRESGMFDRFRDVVETGIPYQGHRVQYADAAAIQRSGRVRDGKFGKRRQAYWTIQVAKFGDGYISASRDVTDIVVAEEATRAACGAGRGRAHGDRPAAGGRAADDAARSAGRAHRCRVRAGRSEPTRRRRLVRRLRARATTASRW